MPPKKKTPKNAFYYFVTELRDEEESRGSKMPQNFKEMADIAAPRWNALSEDEKQFYKDLAKANKGQNGDRLDCTGQSIAEVERKEEEREQREPRMIAFVDNHIKQLHDSNELLSETFYLISFNIFCATRELEYVPAEVGLVEFSIENGMTNSMQRFIDPGPLPVGYASACRLLSETTHQIPFSGIDEDDEPIPRVNGTQVMKDIIDFIDPHHSLDQYPPIYCKTEEIDQTIYILKQLQRRSNRRVDFYVVDFSVLFMKLLQNVSDTMISVGLVRDLLCNTAFTFNENSCCNWHWEKDIPQFCALDVVKRSCFILSDHICDVYGIVPIPNQHLPEKHMDDVVTYKPDSFIHSRSTSAMSLNQSRASSRSSMTLPPTPSSMKPNTLSNSNLKPVWKEAKEELKEPVSLAPMRNPRMPNFASCLTTSNNSFVQNSFSDDFRGARPKVPMSTSSLSTVNGQPSLPKGRGFGLSKPTG